MPVKFPNVMSLLEQSGYTMGYSDNHDSKGWGPGNYEKGGYSHNPAEHPYPSFSTFINQLQPNKPFVFWLGDKDPHRGYDSKATASRYFNIDSIHVPDYMPNVDTVKNDIADYYYEVERFDREAGEALTFLKSKGMLDNTIVIMTSDNG